MRTTALARVSILLLLTTSTALADERPPNVVLIFADDLGYGDLGCYGATKLKTPHIDSLARDGRKFTDAHSASAVCTPSRYALLTGEYPIRANGGQGVWGPLSPLSPLIVDTDTLTIGKAFKAKGYATAAFGKWHLGFGKGPNDWSVPLRPGPNDVGFDHYFGVPLVNSGSPFVYVENDTIVGHDPADPLVHGKKPASPTPRFPPEASVKSPNQFGGALAAHETYDDEKTATLLTEKATEWIAENKEQPFFLYFPTTNIHHPFTPAPRFKGTSDCGLYGDFVHELDWMVGELLKTLDEHGLRENTLVIFTSDNGGMLNRGGRDAMQAGHRINGDLLGFKFGAWEGGHRVPFIARWPGRIEAGTESDQLIGQVDMLATFLALTGQGSEGLENKDSINILPALVGNPEEPLRDELLLAPRQPRNLGIRKGQWMYIGAQGSGGFTGSKPSQHAWGGPAAAKFAGSVNSDIENGRIKPGAPPAQLYDLENDLAQTKNVYREHPEVVKQMQALLDSYRPKVAAPPGKGRARRRPNREQTEGPNGNAPPRDTERAVSALGASNDTQSPPNIIVVMADDLGYADVGFQGCEDIATPNIDQLAASGARFSQGYVTGCMCGPSRAGFITGRIQSTFGYYVNASQPLDPKQGLPAGIRTVAHLMQDQGYSTGGVGKWHMGTADHQHPDAMGYSDWFGFLGGGLMYYPLDHPSYNGRYLEKRKPWGVRDMHHTLPLLHNGRPVEWNQYLTRELTDGGIRFIERNRDRPFFLFVSYNAPHEYLEAPAETIAKYPPESMTKVPGVPARSRSIYAAMVDEMDRGIGRLMRTLDELELADDTVVWFLSDHGGLKRTSDNRPLRGAKGTAYEGGLRVPFVVRWPNRVKPGTVLRHPVTSLDIGATSLALAGGDVEQAGLHGSDITAYMTGRSDDPPHEVLHWHLGRGPDAVTGAMREGDYKMLATRGRVELFNVEDDPTESADLSEKQPQRAERMLAAWKSWNETNRTPLWDEIRSRRDRDAYQYAEYEWLKGTPHYKAGNERGER